MRWSKISDELSNDELKLFPQFFDLYNFDSDIA